MKLFSIASLLMLAVACSKIDESKNVITPQNTSSMSINNKTNDELIKSYLTNILSFSPDDIKEEQDFFIIEDDMLISKNDFWTTFKKEDLSNKNLRHRKWFNLVTKTKNIPVSIYPEVNSTWRKAVTDAINQWNRLNGGVKFYITASNQSVSNGINVFYADLGNDKAIAQGELPTGNGNAGSRVRLNRRFVNMSAYCSMVYTITHEFGHNIGLNHTDTYDGTQLYTNNFTCDNSTDANSLMGRYLPPNSCNTFTSCDIKAFLALYPK